MKVSDSLVSIRKDNKHQCYLDKNNILQLKTPHIYKVSVLVKELCGLQFHDWGMENAEILSSRGKKVGFVEGSIDNIKITHKNDLRVIKKLL